MKKRFLYVVAAALISAFMLTVFAVFADNGHFFDENGYTGAENAAYLDSLLAGYSDEYRLDIAALFVDSLDGKSSMQYADDWYDSRSRGYDGSEDGILLLVCPTSRDYYICTGGRAISVFGNSQLDVVESAIIAYLANDDWYNAVCAFGRSVASVMSGDADVSASETNYFKYALIAIGIGLVAALIILLIMKSNMNNVKKSTVADSYAKGGINITYAFEQFLYRNVTKTKRPEPDSGSGGSRGGGSHHSSSGSSHGGRGGKF